MKKEINPQDTSRSNAFSLWMSSPMPMVTLTKTFCITNLCRYAKKHGFKVNMLLCWCIGKAACRINEFYLLPENGRLYSYDQLAINVIVNNNKGGINSCDIPFSCDLEQFSNDYMSLTRAAVSSCKSSFLENHMVIGTSAVIETELDSVVNQYSDKFNNPMVMWGKFRKGFFRTDLPISFQFHHVQMDGGHAGKFLVNLQQEIKSLR